MSAWGLSENAPFLTVELMDRSFDVLGAKLNHISKRPRFQLVAVVCVCVCACAAGKAVSFSAPAKGWSHCLHSPRLRFPLFRRPALLYSCRRIEYFSRVVAETFKNPPTLKVVQEIGGDRTERRPAQTSLPRVEGPPDQSNWSQARWWVSKACAVLCTACSRAQVFKLGAVASTGAYIGDRGCFHH